MTDGGETVDRAISGKLEKDALDKNGEDSGRGSDRDSLENTREVTPSRPRKQRIKINVGGQCHETYKTTLKNIPDTRLSWITESSSQTVDYDEESKEYFFDRHPAVFSAVLNYYRTGKLHAPLDVCGPLYEEELEFWGIDDQQVESCCWSTYRQHRDAQETLKAFEGIEFQNDFEDDEENLQMYGFNVAEDVTQRRSRWEKYQPKIWSLMEEPQSSKIAKIIGYTSLAFIILSVIIVCLESLEYFAENDAYTSLLILEGICVAWFSAELIIRFIFCPDKKAFLKNVMNWIDFLAIVPFFVGLDTNRKTSSGDAKVEILLILRLIRIFRIFKLSRHSTDLQILGHTLKASVRELILLIFFLLIGVVIFSSLIYYCEKDVEDTKFKNIPAASWWAIVTMTTVGYGDMAPVTVLGKIVGSLCAVSGVLMIALPVPVIVNNFSLYYSHAQARLKLPKKRRRVLVNADNALKTDFVFADRESIVKVGEDGNDENGRRESRNRPRCSLAITDETNDVPAKRFHRRESHLFGATVDGENGVAPMRPPGLTMSKRRSLMPRVPVLPEVE